MKIKAMVDGIEREVELTREQWTSAFNSVQTWIDGQDFDWFMDDFFSDSFEEEDREMIVNAKDDILWSYRDYIDGDCDWRKYMSETIADYIYEHKQ